MAVIEVHPFIVRDAILTVGADDFTTAVREAKMSATASQVEWPNITGDVMTETTPAKWDLNISYAQDWGTPGSLSNYLFDHEGEEKEMVLTPKAGGMGFKVTVTITAGDIGGTANEWAVATVRLGCKRKPIKVPA